MKRTLLSLVVLLVLLEHIFLISAIASATIFKETTEVPVTKTQIEKKQAAISLICKDNYIASVISKSKYPYTLAAIAKVESDYRPRAVGDGGKSWGMYQIQRRLHGEFRDTIESQTDKAEDILEALINEQGYYNAIKAYNGTGRPAIKYRQKVLKIVRELETIERRS